MPLGRAKYEEGKIHNRLAVLRAERGLTRQSLADAFGKPFRPMSEDLSALNSYGRPDPGTEEQR